MRDNYKKRNRSKTPKRDLKNIEKIQKLSNTPKHDYNKYSDKMYYSTPSKPPSRKPSRTSPPARPLPAKNQSASNKRTNRRKAKKKKTRFFMGRIAFLITFIIGVIYLIGIVVETSQKPVISYQMVQRGVIDNSDVFHGLIIRDEQVIRNSKEGNMYLIAAEGDKVRRNGEVYQVLEGVEFARLEKDIQNVESDIEKTQVKRQDISYYQNEIQSINNTIDSHVEVYYMQSKPGELDQTHELKKQLEYEIVKRKNIHMKDNTVALDELQVQKKALSSQLNDKEAVFKAAEPGIISYYVDGFEENFTIDNIDQILPKDLKEKYTNKSTTQNQIIQQNEPAYRLIKDNQWKMVCFIPESWSSNFQKGHKYEFAMLEDSQIEFTLKVEDNIPQGKENKIIFSSNELLDEFLTKRTVSFKSLQYTYEGLKIPVSSIVERNLIKIPADYIVDIESGRGVMKSSNDNQMNIFQSLNIQYQDDNGYAHILQNLGEKNHLKLGETIAHPSKADQVYILSEVSTTKGVYAVNGRITKFKPINIITQNTEYAIVQSNSVNGLKEFDQIVSNPKNIQEEQLLRTMDVKNSK